MKENRNIRYIIGNEEILAHIKDQNSFAVFALETISFLNLWSQNIRRDERTRLYSEVVTFAFFIRKSNVVTMAQEYGDVFGNCGLGMNLTFASSNVPLMFAYSMAASLLAGNSVVIRLSQHLFPQDEVVITALQKTLEDEPKWKDRILLLQYDHDQRVNDILSSMCNSRIIWGGDKAIKEICQSSIPRDAAEALFGDRKSLCIMDGKEIAEMEDISHLARAFFNDTYLNDQNACSSPSVIFWIGKEAEIALARSRFWEALGKVVEKEYEVDALWAVKKLEMAMIFASVYPNTRVETKTNRLFIIQSEKIDQNVWDYLAPAGYFIEICHSSEEDIRAILTEKVQTMTVYGKSAKEIGKTLLREKVLTHARMVEVGHALDFSLIWDGVDLIRMLSRKCGM